MVYVTQDGHVYYIPVHVHVCGLTAYIVFTSLIHRLQDVDQRTIVLPYNHTVLCVTRVLVVQCMCDVCCDLELGEAKYAQGIWSLEHQL